MIQFAQFISHPAVIAVLLVWTLPWKGIALWKAARLYHRGWFVALLVLNTVAILDIIYIFFVARPAEREELSSPDSEDAGMTSGE